MDRIGIVEQAGHACETVLGIVLAVTPVALWVAWTPGLLAWVVVAAIACSVLLVLLAHCLPRAAEREADGTRNLLGRVGLPGAIEEVHRLFPMIYHHSSRNNSRFRQVMARLSRWIEDSERFDKAR